MKFLHGVQRESEAHPWHRFHHGYEEGDNISDRPGHEATAAIGMGGHKGGDPFQFEERDYLADRAFSSEGLPTSLVDTTAAAATPALDALWSGSTKLGGEAADTPLIKAARSNG